VRGWGRQSYPNHSPKGEQQQVGQLDETSLLDTNWWHVHGRLKLFVAPFERDVSLLGFACPDLHTFHVCRCVVAAPKAQSHPDQKRRYN